MKDIKTLYLVAKSSGRQQDIDAYTECVHNLLENSPNDYITNLEYIISSNIGLSTLNGFIEKHGISIASYNSIMECLGNGVKKCLQQRKDYTPYQEAIEIMEYFKRKYSNCFIMFETFQHRMPDKYIDAYYKNFPLLRNIKGKVNISGMLSRYGESCIPDMLIYANQFGNIDMMLGSLIQENKVSKTDNKTNSIPINKLSDLPKELQTGIKETYEKLMTILHDNIFDEDEFKPFKKLFPTLKSNFPFDITTGDSKIHHRNNGSKYDGYYGYISITQSKKTNFMANITDMLFKVAPEEESVLDELRTDPEKLWTKLVKKVSKETEGFIKDKFNYIDDFGVDIEHLDNFGMNLKEEYVKKTFFPEDNVKTESAILYQWILESMNDISNSSSNNIEGAFNMLNKSRDQAIQSREAYGKNSEEYKKAQRTVKTSERIYNDAMKEYKKSFKKDIIPPEESSTLDQTSGEWNEDERSSEIQDQSLPIRKHSLEGIVESIKIRNAAVYRESVLTGNDNITLKYTQEEVQAIKDLITFKEYQLTCLENTNEIFKIQSQIYSLYEEFADIIEEDTVDSVLPMIPTSKSTGVIREGQWLSNTQNKKTGQMPDYIAKNHDLDYGEDNISTKRGKPESDPDDEPSLDDFRRPSVHKNKSPDEKISPLSYSSDPNNDDSHNTTTISAARPEEKQSAMNNYYYYTYTNSNNTNTNTNSFNKHNRDDHSTHINTTTISSKDESTYVERYEDNIVFKYTYRIVKADDGETYLITFDIGGPNVINYKLHYPMANRMAVSLVGKMPTEYLQKHGSDNYVSEGNKIISIKNVKTGEMVNSIYATGAIPDEKKVTELDKFEYTVGGLSPLCYKTTIPIFPLLGDVKTPYGNMKGISVNLYSPKDFLNPFKKRRIDFSKPILYKPRYGNIAPIIKDILLSLRDKISSYVNQDPTQISREINQLIQSHNLYRDYSIAPLNDASYDEIVSMMGIFISNCAKNISNEPWKHVPLDHLYNGLLIGFFGPRIGGSKYINIDIMEPIISDRYKLDSSLRENISDWFTLIGNGLAQIIAVPVNKTKEFMNCHRGVIVTIRDTFYVRDQKPILESTWEELCEQYNAPFNPDVNSYCESAPWELNIFQEDGVFTEGIFDIFKRKSPGIKIPEERNLSNSPSEKKRNGFEFISGTSSIRELEDEFMEFLCNKYQNIETTLMMKAKEAEIQYKLLGKALDCIDSDYSTSKPWGDHPTTDIFIPQIVGNYNDNIIFLGDTGEDILWNRLCPNKENNPNNLTHVEFRRFLAEYDIPEEIFGGASWTNFGAWPRDYWGAIAEMIFEHHTYKKIQENIQLPNVQLKTVYDDTSWDGLFGISVVFTDLPSSVEEFNKINGEKGTVRIINPQLISEAVGDADENKPTSDNPVRDTLMDIDRKIVSKQQAVKKTVQDVQNVGKAIVKPFQRTAQWINSMIARWKDANENDIKERMADPHARKNLFNVIKKSIIRGSLYKAGILINPIFLFLTITKKICDNKNEFRIRNEVIGELKTELQIIDEKIKDADRNGDNTAKYQLMRFKNELNKKLIRVGGTKDMAKIL